MNEHLRQIDDAAKWIARMSTGNSGPIPGTTVEQTRKRLLTDIDKHVGALIGTYSGQMMTSREGDC